MGNYQNNPLNHSFENSLEFPKLKVGIAVSEWNPEVTEALYSGALQSLIQLGCVRENITKVAVPGSYELPLACQWLAENDSIDAVIALGCVIQGETPHFQFICDAVAHGLMDLNLKFNKPVVFGVLTTNSQQQAIDRAGGKHGNKGEEAAITAMKMLAVKN